MIGLRGYYCDFCEKFLRRHVTISARRDLTVCRLSAEALGKKISKRFTVYQDKPAVCLENGFAWNPLLNAEQRWECLEQLRKDGYCVHFAVADDVGHWLSKPGEEYASGSLATCPASEFPARAVAELQLRKEKA